MNNRRLIVKAIAALSLGSVFPVRAQGIFPNKPIRFLVPFSAGGGPDLLARIIALQLGKQLGQTVIVENRLGANGLLAGEAVSKSPPDGYSLLIATGSQAINPSIYKKMPYDTIQDFAPVGLISVAPALTLVVNTGFPAKTFTQFLELARKPESNISFGSPGTGNTLHLAGELLNSIAGTHMLHVPYKGAAPALNAVLSGEVSACFLSTTAAVLAVRGGQVRPLAVTSAKRINAFPDVPTMAESGVPSMDYNGGWIGLFAPSKTPQPIIDLISTELNKAMQTPDVREKMILWDNPPVQSTPHEFGRFFQFEIEKYARIVKLANVPPQ